MMNKFEIRNTTGFKIAVFTLFILVLTVCSASDEPVQTYSSEASEFEDSSNQRLSHIGFESFENGLPVGMDSVLTTISGDSVISNRIERDSSVFLSEHSSLRITGSDSTDTWYRIELDIPGDFHCITANLFAKGSGLHQSGNQYDNCIIGFFYNGLEGDNTCVSEQLPRDDYDWTVASVSLDTETEPAENIRFVILSSISGSLWIDNLSFQYDDDCEAIPEETISGALADYIDDLKRPVTFIEIPPPYEGDCQYSISAAELSEDIEFLKYLLENGYSGYEFWSYNGIDFSAIYDSLEVLVQRANMVAVGDIERTIVDGLQGLQDGHFGIRGLESYNFLERSQPFFTDVLVEVAPLELDDSSADSLYIVIQSRCESVEQGMIYAGPEDHLFRILSRPGTEQYQLGVFSSEYLREADFHFEADPAFLSSPTSIVTVTLPLHECRLTRRIDDMLEGVYNRTDVDGIDLIRIRSFSNEYYDTLQEFVSIGDSLATKDRFIVDLTGNTGGNSNYPQCFVRSLNGIAQWRMYFAMLCSPATIGSRASLPITEDLSEPVVNMITSAKNTLELLRNHPVRNWIIRTDSLSPRQMGNYSGQAVFLFDRNVASSGEAFIDYSLSVPGAIHVGENSAGIGTFGEVELYWLPNSHIRLSLPCKLFLAPGFEEGVGYTPEYWLDSVEPISEISSWMNNPDSYQFELPDIPQMHNLGFEEFEDECPLHMSRRIGARNGNSEVYLQITQDMDIKSEGESSLRLKGDSLTTQWYALFMDIPDGLDILNVEYDVRGENIRREGNQFNSCYVGVSYKDSNGDVQRVYNSYEGSFDWRADSLQLNPEELGASNLQFIIFLNMSGSFWVDDVVFQYE